MESDAFEAGRHRLASLAYRLLGSAADAEDVVQDAYLRWQTADRDYVEVPEAWLTKAVANLCVDRLRSATYRHERAVESLPEPVLAGDPMLGPADTAEQRESVSIAVLTLMGRLTPHQRAAYVLREAFSHSHAEIAEILDITQAASQQHVHRARAHIAAGRRAREAREVDPATARRVVEEFLDAAASGRTEDAAARRYLQVLDAVAERAGLTVDAVGADDDGVVLGCSVTEPASVPDHQEFTSWHRMQVREPWKRPLDFNRVRVAVQRARDDASPPRRRIRQERSRGLERRPDRRASSMLERHRPPQRDRLPRRTNSGGDQHGVPHRRRDPGAAQHRCSGCRQGRGHAASLAHDDRPRARSVAGRRTVGSAPRFAT